LALPNASSAVGRHGGDPGEVLAVAARRPCGGRKIRH
jgi:hypothetical protein